jgi:hypothetical protein
MAAFSGVRSFAFCSKAERAAVDEDEQAEGDQHDRVQEMPPAADDPRDGGAGGEEPAGGAPGTDQDQEDGGVDGDPTDPAPCEDRQVDADVVAAVGEGDSGNLERLRAVLPVLALLAAAAVPVGFPCLPGGPKAQGQRQEPEVGEGRLGQEGRSAGGGDGDGQERGEAEVLPGDDPPGRAVLPGAAAEEQRQHQDVVDVGDGEQPGRRRDDAGVHAQGTFRPEGMRLPRPSGPNAVTVKYSVPVR